MITRLLPNPQVWKLRFLDVEGRKSTLLIVRESWDEAHAAASAYCESTHRELITISLVGPVAEIV